jgi:hypothetical protein
MSPLSSDRDVITPTFAQLVEGLEAAGLKVGLALADDGRHAITVLDTATARSIRMHVERSVDDAAGMLVLSMCLRQSVGMDDTGPCPTNRPAGYAIGRWPEFPDLWPGGHARQ